VSIWHNEPICLVNHEIRQMLQRQASTRVVQSMIVAISRSTPYGVGVFSELALTLSGRDEIDQSTGSCDHDISSNRTRSMASLSMLRGIRCTGAAELG